MFISLQNYPKAYDNLNCKWDNYKNIPCIEINKNLSNSSKFSKKGINKIVIGKKNLYCFIKSEFLWHSVKKLDIPIDDVRKLVLINIKI